MASTPFDELCATYAPSASRGNTLGAAAAALREEVRFDINLVVHVDTTTQALVDVANEALASYALSLYAASEEELTATLRPGRHGTTDPDQAGTDWPLATSRPAGELDQAATCDACASLLCSDRDRPGISDAPRLIEKCGTRKPGALITAQL